MQRSEIPPVYSPHNPRQGRHDSRNAKSRKIMKSLHLDLDEEKTGITKTEKGFDFLGFHFVRHFSRRRNKRVTR